MRSRHLVALVTALVTAAVAADGPVEAGPVAGELVECGQTVDHSLRVANNLENCPGDGLVVGADGITIDFGGHRIDGDESGHGSGVENLGHVGVTVRNGTVSGFQFGVSFSSNAQGVVSGMQAIGNEFGIGVSNSDAKSVIKGNLVSANSNAGLRLFGHSATVFQDNSVVGNAKGIAIEDASSATFLKNRVIGNTGVGIDLQGDTITIKSNTVAANGDDGIVISMATQNVLSRNVISANTANGIAFSAATDNTLAGNVASGNTDDGIRVGDSTGNTLTGNVTLENGTHGISSTTSAVTLVGNRADRNGFIGGGGGDDVGAGIFVPAGTTNAKNKAGGNDDPHECEPSDLSCYVP